MGRKTVSVFSLMGHWNRFERFDMITTKDELTEG
jgi:hypothetical protein